MTSLIGRGPNQWEVVLVGELFRLLQLFARRRFSGAGSEGKPPHITYSSARVTQQMRLPPCKLRPARLGS
jgi:hypothetical protein